MYTRHVKEYESGNTVKISDAFELIYLRHDYLRKVGNPAPGRLEEFEDIVTNMSKLFFAKNQAHVKMIGMELEDIQNIFRVFVVSFIGMSGLYENPDKMSNFVKLHKKRFGQESEPTKQDVFVKERYDLSRFLRQRMKNLIDKFKNSKKAKSITGYIREKTCIVANKKAQGVEGLSSLEDYKKHGYSKISKKKYLQEVSLSKVPNKNDFVNKEGKHFLVVYEDNNFLTEDFIIGSDLDPRNNMYLRDPEEEYMIAEERFERKLKK